MNNRIYIIGTGKVGTSFALELRDKGFEINFLTDRNKERLELISSLVHPIAFSEKTEMNFISGSDIIIISVQDRYISEVINQISEMKINLKEKYFMITSGSESTGLFPIDKFNENLLASVHPVQTFNKIDPVNNHLLENIYFGIEGGTDALNLAKQIIEKLNSMYIEIPKEKKYLYHSACVISSNFLVTLLNISSELLGNIGIEKNKTFEIFKPIIENTLHNVSKDGIVNSLTGPFERNDLETISNHLNSINKELPSLLPFYTLLGMETVKVAFKKESLNLKNVISILDIMNEYIVNEFNITKKTIN